ncbi:hypothetical protein GQ457_05G031990 [Hibiscus cannabinus]
MQRRWKSVKQREEQDHVGSEGRIRSRQMRHDKAPEEEEFKNDWILDRSTAVIEDADDDDEDEENSRYALKIEFERSAPTWKFSESESVSESEKGDCADGGTGAGWW